jgi:hypothetical protein
MAQEFFKVSHAFIEQEIRKLRDAGKLDNLPGAGKPIPDIDEAYDPDWWIKSLLKREKLSVMPETLRLRVEIEHDIAKLWTLPSENAVRDAVMNVNAKVRRMNATAHAGPITNMSEMDVELVVARWRKWAN